MRNKLGNLATKDLQEIADNLPEIWIQHKVTHNVLGEWLFLSPLPNPYGNKIDKNAYYTVSYSGYTFMNHFKKMRKIARNCKNDLQRKEKINQYVKNIYDGKY